jgi:hypothetical protein
MRLVTQSASVPVVYTGPEPAEGTGSQVIVLRHLERFAADGHPITVVTEWGANAEAARTRGWDVLRIPLRRWWWPPVNLSGTFSRRLAVRLWGRELARLLPRKARILTYLAGYSDLFPEIAVAAADATGVPVHCLVHDEPCWFEQDASMRVRMQRRHARLMQRQTNWFVSRELASRLAPAGARVHELLPIPEGRTAAHPPPPPARNKVVYAGHLWPAQAELLGDLAKIARSVGVSVEVLARESPECRSLVEAGLVRHRPLFPRNRQALEWLAREASGVLVSYGRTLEAFPLARDSFPSKWLEYAHLGLPVAVIAPRDAAVMRWAAREGFRGAFDPSEEQSILDWFRAICTPEGRYALGAQSLELARGPFSAERIHRQLSGILIQP